jgi:hypothetical protein
MTRFNIDQTPGFGIAEQTFLIADDVAVTTDTDRFRLICHRRGGLIQDALLDDQLRQAGHLVGLHHSDWPDLVFDEVWPMLQEELPSTTYTIDGVSSTGESMTYRGISFLFSTLPWDTAVDFVLWRLPSVGPDTPWPEVTTAD